MTTDLKILQQAFKAAVTDEEDTPSCDLFLTHIKKGGLVSASSRLYIYRYAYRARLADTLAEDFPALHTMLGDADFDSLCQDYANTRPSHHPSLRYFGQYMAVFLARTPPYRDQEILAEMARFEMAFQYVFDATDASVVTVAEVAALDPAVWTCLRFCFHPTVSVSVYAWNTAAIWSSVETEAEGTVLPEKLPEPVSILHWRQDLRCHFRSLPPDEATALALARDNKVFPEICEALAVTHGDQAPARAAALLKGWVAAGLISALDYFQV